MRTLIRPWTSPDPALVPLCDDCRAGVRHDFLAVFSPAEGQQWTKTIHAIGPNEAKFLAGEIARDEAVDTTCRIGHAPALDDEEDDPDQWKAYRDLSPMEQWNKDANR